MKISIKVAAFFSIMFLPFLTADVFAQQKNVATTITKKIDFIEVSLAPNYTKMIFPIADIETVLEKADGHGILVNITLKTKGLNGQPNNYWVMDSYYTIKAKLGL